MSTETVRVALVCVRNAGRSQIATAFAERERDRRDLGETVEILTGGTHPADEVHEEVVDVMREDGFDLAGRVPREITTGELESCDYVATMGCSTLDLDADSAVEVRDWALDDPKGRDLDSVRETRDEIRDLVAALFDDVEQRLEDPPT